ncbi:MAG: M50 family metallopeptidase [Muribaculaceae bacterium]|nr:M50 family metallopeptidase [Muribaculaceae bacterium]
MIKTIFKILVGLLAGGLLGLLLGGLIVVVFTDTTWAEYIAKYYTIDFSEGLAVVLVAITSLIVSFFILVTLHELGHLVCGLLTGYKFVSFRIFNYTFFKQDGNFRIKKFAIPGTGGQCLLAPPDLPVKDMRTGWYNFGGIFANIIVLVIALPFFFLDLKPFVAEALGVFVATDAFIILINGIPMRAGGVGNDAYNMILLRRNLLSKRGIVCQLRANALIQSGMRPKDMPEELFSNPDEIDYSNALEVSIPLMYASRLVDMAEYEEAKTLFESLYSHKEEIMPLYVNEIACELSFLYLRTGEIDKAERLLDKNLRKYITAYKAMMSSKMRLLSAIYLYLEHDETKATEIYRQLKAREEEYLLQGEVRGDIALVEDMLKNRK